MSEQANKEVVRQVYAAFLRKDLPAVLELQADDVVWSVAGPAEQIPWAGPLHGREGVADFLKTLAQWLVAEEFDIREYLAEADTVVALGSQRGHVRPTGTSYAFDFVHVWTLREERVTSFRVYYDTFYVAAALHAAAEVT
jgi:ketosteroid isomerase-like protein